MEQKLTIIIASLFTTFGVFLAVFAMFWLTLISIQGYERWQLERTEGHRCLVWSRR